MSRIIDYGISADELWRMAKEKLLGFIKEEHRGYKIDGVPSECHIFTGADSGRGRGGFYGRVRFRGRVWAAHRLSWRAHVGPIREGMDLDHKCNQRRCIRPEHLEEVTHLENCSRREMRLAETKYATEMAERKPVEARELPRDDDGPPSPLDWDYQGVG